MLVILEAAIKTPIITKLTTFHLIGCQFTIQRPRRRYINKITVGKAMYPYSFIGYMGTLVVRYTCNTLDQARRKIKQLYNVKYIDGSSMKGWEN